MFMSACQKGAFLLQDMPFSLNSEESNSLPFRLVFDRGEFNQVIDSCAVGGELLLRINQVTACRGEYW
jgi:hypothetical protein